MSIEELRDLCLSHKGVSEDIKWGVHLCFSVGDKMFMITSPDEVPVNASFKCDGEDFVALSARSDCRPSPYLARHQWIRVEDISSFSKKQWKSYVNTAWSLTAQKLSKAARRKLGIE